MNLNTMNHELSANSTLVLEGIGREDADVIIVIGFDRDAWHRHRHLDDWEYLVDRYVEGHLNERSQSVGVVWWFGNPERIRDLFHLANVLPSRQAPPLGAPAATPEGRAELALMRALHAHRAQPEDVVISGVLPSAIKQGEQFPIDIVFHLRSLAPIPHPDLALASEVATVGLKPGAKFRVEVAPPPGLSVADAACEVVWMLPRQSVTFLLKAPWVMRNGTYWMRVAVYAPGDHPVELTRFYLKVTVDRRARPIAHRVPQLGPRVPVAADKLVGRAVRSLWRLLLNASPLARDLE